MSGHHPWVVRWFGEYDPSTDKQRRYSKSFRLKREAEQFQAGKQAELDKGGQRDRPEDVTLKQFCDVYMDRRKHEWAEKTRMDVKRVSERLIDSFGGNFQLSKMSKASAIQFWSNVVKVKSDQVGQSLRPASRNVLLRYLKTMFKYAVEWNLLSSNPYQGIRAIRSGKVARRRWHYIKPNEFQALLGAAPDLRWKSFYALAYTSAARFGELFNLTPQDVDFDRELLVIRNREATTETPPFHVKDYEEREVPLPEATLKIVREWMEARPSGSPYLLIMPDRYDRIQSRWQNCQQANKPWLNEYMVNNVLREVRRHANQAGLTLDGVLTIHAFRKSCGQNWANHLPMNVVKEFMGHASISTTVEFYNTVSEEHLDKARWIMNALSFNSKTLTDAKMTPGANSGVKRKVS